MPNLYLARTIRQGIVALFCLVMANVGETAFADGIRLTTQEWDPYQHVQDGKLDGIAVRAMRCIMDKMQLPYDIDVMPWRRAQFEVERGAADGFFAATRTPERDAFAEISAPIAPQVWRWYLLPDNMNKLTDSFDLTVGVLSGSAMERFLKDSHYTHIQNAPTTENLIKLLKSGRFDAVLANDMVVADTMRSLNMPSDTLRSVVQGDHPLGAYFGKSFLAAHAGFLAKFNAMIKNCRQ